MSRASAARHAHVGHQRCRAPAPAGARSSAPASPGRSAPGRRCSCAGRRRPATGRASPRGAGDVGNRMAAAALVLCEQPLAALRVGLRDDGVAAGVRVGAAAVVGRAISAAGRRRPGPRPGRTTARSTAGEGGGRALGGCAGGKRARLDAAGNAICLESAAHGAGGARRRRAARPRQRRPSSSGAAASTCRRRRRISASSSACSVWRCSARSRCAPPSSRRRRSTTPARRARRGLLSRPLRAVPWRARRVARRRRQHAAVPDSLIGAARHWRTRELYWLTRYGIKMSGMPAWEFRLGESDLWAVVAFLERLPMLSTADYAADFTAVAGDRAPRRRRPAARAAAPRRRSTGGGSCRAPSRRRQPAAAPVLLHRLPFDPRRAGAGHARRPGARGLRTPRARRRAPRQHARQRRRLDPLAARIDPGTAMPDSA